MRRSLGLVLLAGLLGKLLPASLTAAVQSESDVKAVLLYNFTQFAQWPVEAFDSGDSPLVIGVIGHDPFGEVLDQLVGPEQVQGRSVVLRRSREPRETAGCHVLFISASERGRVTQILEAVRGQAVLTVAEFDDFIARGGMVQFYRAPNFKIRLRINLTAAKAAGLTLSAKLLRVADTVQPE